AAVSAAHPPPAAPTPAPDEAALVFTCQQVWCPGVAATRAYAAALRRGESVHFDQPPPMLWMRRPRGVPCETPKVPDARVCILETKQATAPAPIAVLPAEDIELLLTPAQRAKAQREGTSVDIEVDR